jgi:probable phosphoglycerate mutase
MSVEDLKHKIHERPNPEKVSFWFVRHAESEENAKGENAAVMHDAPLTESGLREAKQAADYLADQQIKFSHIFTSSKDRSKQTAEILGEKLKIPVVADKGLDERNWGEYKNYPWKDVAARLGEMAIEERYKHVPPGGESWANMEERLLKALEKIADETKDGENVPLGSISKFSFDKDEFDFVGLKPDDKNE